MAKAKDEAVANVPAVMEEDLFAGFSDEERAEMLGLTGQATNMSFDKTPILKINQFSSDIQEGDKIVKMGNFVLGQITRKDGDNEVIDDIGEDFGAHPEITVLKFGNKYSYFPKNKDKKLMCQSQLVMDAGERATGDRLGFDCLSGGCPRRSKDLKDDKCKCQYVVFVEVGPEKKKAIMYAKGDSFMPFKEYLDSANKYPVFFFPTKLVTTKKTNGTNTYWVISPELQKDRPYPAEERKRLMEEARKIDDAARNFESQRKLIASNKKTEASKQLPPGMSVEPPAGTGGSAGIGGGSNVSDAEFGEISF